MPKQKMTEEEVRKSLIEARRTLHKKLGKNPSISAICREAKISRAYLYASFSHLVDEFSTRTRAARQEKKAVTIASLKKELKELRNWNALLARSCIELKLALTLLQSKYQRDTKPKRKSGKSK
jgi:5-formyltetrahydrofolate cyclo-ligase